MGELFFGGGPLPAFAGIIVFLLCMCPPCRGLVLFLTFESNYFSIRCPEVFQRKV